MEARESKARVSAKGHAGSQEGESRDIRGRIGDHQDVV